MATKQEAALKAALRALNAQPNFAFHVGDNPAGLPTNGRDFATSYALAAHISELLQEASGPIPRAESLPQRSTDAPAPARYARAKRRYFKATNGTVTIFRASDARVYQSAWIQLHPTGAVHLMGFSARQRGGELVVEEIVKSDYDTLVARKNARLKAIGARDDAFGEPRNSWVNNEALS